MRIVLFISAAISFHTTHAINYYISTKGNDSYNGRTKTSPWYSLQKINDSHLIKPGDSILLERGSTFKGELTISVSDIYVGAYGSGLKPVISGSTELKKWTLHSKNIWKAECLTCIAEPGNLFIDGKFQSLGRYPNTGYLIISGSKQNDVSILDTTLQFADGYWDKAEVVVKSSRWTLDNLPVTRYYHKEFSFITQASYLLQNGFGYFIQKHLSTLDMQGEWFYDTSTKQIYLYLVAGIKPSSHTIEISTTELGLSVMNTTDVRIDNLTFKYHRLAEVRLKDCENIQLQNVDISSSGKNGLEVISCINPLIKNNAIKDSNSNGVDWRDNIGGSFTHNTISRTGLHPGRGVSGNGTHIALNITADNERKENTLFQYNTIDSTGYIGVDFRTGHTQIKNNIVSNFCMTKDDGAGIYTWNNTKGENIIDENIVTDGIGSPEGAINSTELFVSGIYIDDKSSHISIKDNTISNCATSGILLHNSKFITIIGNTLFGNGNSISNKEKGQLYIKLDTLGQLAGDIALHLDIQNNKWIASNNASYCVYLSADKKQDLRMLGTFKQNNYSAIHDWQAIAESYIQPGLCWAPIVFQLKEWQNFYHYEYGSDFTSLPDAPYFAGINKEMIQNSGMTANIDGWLAWPSAITITQERKNAADGPSLKVNIPADCQEALLYYSGFTLSNQKSYRLSFSAMSMKPGKIEFASLMATAPWKAVSDYTCFSTDSTYKVYTYYFKPNKACKEARLNFKSYATFWIDNVSLYEISEAKDSEELIKMVYNKTENSKLIRLSGEFYDPADRSKKTLVIPPYQSRLLLSKKTIRAIK